VPDIKENIMADPAAQRAYVKDISNAIPEFNGQKIHLQRFITALKLVYLTKGTFENWAVEVTKSKIIGSTLYKVQNETTINSKMKKLQDTIVGETSDVVKAKMAKKSQKGKTDEKFKEAITTVVKNCEHGRLKAVLEAGNFTTMNEAVTKYIQCSTEMTGNENSILYTQRGNSYRGSNFRNTYRGRGNNRGNYQHNGYYQYNMDTTKITVITETLIIRPTTIIEVVVIIEEPTVMETKNNRCPRQGGATVSVSG